MLIAGPTRTTNPGTPGADEAASGSGLRRPPVTQIPGFWREGLRFIEDAARRMGGDNLAAPFIRCPKNHRACGRRGVLVRASCREVVQFRGA